MIFFTSIFLSWCIIKINATIYIDSLNLSPSHDGSFGNPYESISQALNFSGASSVYDFEILSDGDLSESAPLIFYNNLSLLVKNLSLSYSKMILLNSFSIFALNGSFIQMNKLVFVFGDNFTGDVFFDIREGSHLLLEDCRFNLSDNVLLSQFFYIQNFSEIKLNRAHFIVKNNNGNFKYLFIMEGYSVITLNSVNFEDISYNSGLLLLATNNSKIWIQDSVIKNCIFNKGTGVIQTDSELSISNLTINNSILGNVSFFFFFGIELFFNKNYQIIANFTKIYFNNITQNELNSNNGFLIDSSFKNFEFFIDYSSFQDIYSYSNMISVQGSNCNFTFSNSLFKNNYVYGLISLNFVVYVKFTNVLVINQNNPNIIQINSNYSSFLKLGGTCFRIYNSFERSLINITISDSFSNFTVIGFQIIDSSEFIDFVKAKGKLTGSRQIRIDKCHFSNNFVFYEANMNTSGIFYIDSDSTIFLLDSYFFNNSINSTSNPDQKIGGPCLNSFSYANNMIINGSIFGFNRAKYSTNCLSFQGISLNTTASYFFGNNPIYDITEEISYYEFNNMGFTRLLESHLHANGGAILSRANILYVTDCFFFNNSNYRGGGIHVESDEYQQILIATILNSVFFNNSVGTLGAALSFGQTKNLNGLVENNLFLSNDGKYGGGLTTEYSSQENYLLVNNNSFYSNKAEYGGSIIGHHTGGLLDIRNCYFYNNSAKKIPDVIMPIAGGAVTIWGGIFTYANFSNNVYVDNTADTHGGAVVFLGGDSSMFNEQFYNNSVNGLGIIGLGFQAIVRINNSIIVNGFSTYRCGGIVVNEFSKLFIFNMTMSNCSAKEKGGALEISETSTFYGEKMLIKNCFSNTGAALLAFEGNSAVIIFIDCLFEGNSALSSILDLRTTKIIFTKCLFIENKNTLFIIEDSFLTFISSRLQTLNCSNSCFAIYSSNCYLKIENSQFDEINTGAEQHAFYLYFSIANIRNSKFSNISQGKASFLAFNTQINIINTLFSSNFPSVFIIEESTANIDNVTFEHRKLESESFLFLNNIQNLYINQCLFMNNKATSEGGGINAVSTLYRNNSQTIILNQCNFTSSYSMKQGGVLFLCDISIQIISCYFFNNSALEGGAIYYKTSSEESNSSFKIENSIFERNEAIMGGGAIMWVNKIPEINIKTVLFKNNMAKYGNDIVSNLMRIGIKILDFNQNSASFTTIFDSMKDTSSFSINNQKAGNFFNKTLIFSFLDYYNQTVSSLDQTLESFDLLTENQFSFFLNNGFKLPENLDNLALKTFIAGPKSFPIKEGILKPQEMEIYAKPNSSVYLFFHPSSLTFFSNNLKTKIPFEYEIKKNYYIMIKVKISTCEIGEITRENDCYSCEYTQYSLNIKDTNCKKCPDGAFCKGKAELVVNDGFWRSSNLSDNVIDCQLSKTNCIGGLYSSCSDMFYGPLCRTCPVRYYNINNQYCLYCEDQVWNVVRVISMMILLFIAITVLIKSTFDNNKIFDMLKDSNQKGIILESNLMQFIDLQSFYIKILVNWIQLSSLLYIIPLGWPQFVLDFLSLFSFFSSISTKFMAFECLFSQDGYEDWKPYVRPLAVNLMPIVLVIMTVIFWKIYQRVKREKEIYDKIYASLLGIYMMMQQNILNECAGSLFCIQINGVNVLKNEPLYSCDSDLHYYMKSLFLWPMFMLWSFSLPLIILAYLFKNRNRLYEAHVFKKMNFFYIGYSSKYFYWDILILLRKSLSIFINLFSGSSLNFELMALMMIMSLYFKYLLANKPFLSSKLNFLESLATFVGIFGLFLALLINMLTVESERIIFYVGILILNIFFLTLWSSYFLLYLMASYKKIIKKKYPKLLDKFRKIISKFDIFIPAFFRMTSAKISGRQTPDWKTKISSLIFGKLKGKKTEEQSLKEEL